MKHSSDMTLFAWGSIIGECCGFGSEDAVSAGARDAFKYLLASSPKDFESPSIYTPTVVKCEHVQHTYPPSTPVRVFTLEIKHISNVAIFQGTQESQATGDPQNGPFDRVELPRVTFTSYGVECRLPLFHAGDVTIALLLCQFLPSREHVGLILMRDPSSRDAYRPLYHAGCGLRRAKPHIGANGVIRLMTLGRDLHNIRFDGAIIRPEWRTIYILTSPPAGLTATHAAISRLSFNCTPNPFVYFPHWLLSRLSMLTFQALEQSCAHRHGVRFISPTGEHITVEIGVCSLRQRWDGSLTHWARVSCSRHCPYEGNTHVHDAHDCAKDHVISWPLWTKEFGTKERTVRLSFVPHERARKSTLIVHLELKGAAYENMLQKAQTVIPSQEELDMMRAFPKERWGDRRLGPPLRGNIGYREFLQSQLWRLGPSGLGLGLCVPSSACSHKSGRMLITPAHPGRSRVPFIVREEFRLIYPYVDALARQAIDRLGNDTSSRNLQRWDTWPLD
ncbi:hypothetical protein GSI_04257 [Ganoderma sinense ZZ0214-1]|uniref:Uncharacterized protein n=1 Tax=Ganoderma sinense ZZ0214-1 TaxID=1077348 RepID=A0A2G8SIN9_9APHY|nr:hypothetical protein GSI_04257 [Ganoderma sinense ZZ0214-1]